MSGRHPLYGTAGLRPSALIPDQEARIREIVANAIEDWELHRVGPPLEDSPTYRQGLRETITTALRRGDERRGR